MAEIHICVCLYNYILTEIILKEKKMKVTQACLTLRDLMDYTAHGILQALAWLAIPFSRGSYQPRDRTQVSHIAGRFFNS